MSAERANDESLSGAEVTDLYRRFGFFMRRRCALILRDPMLVDDAMQETFVRVMRSGAVLRGMEHPLRWLYRVSDRCAIDQLRRGKRLRTAERIGDHEDDVGGYPHVAFEVRDAVLELMGELDETEQRICVLAFVDGMTQGDIAEEIGFSRITVNKKIAGIRERAERMLGGAR